MAEAKPGVSTQNQTTEESHEGGEMPTTSPAPPPEEKPEGEGPPERQPDAKPRVTRENKAR